MFGGVGFKSARSTILLFGIICYSCFLDLFVVVRFFKGFYLEKPVYPGWRLLIVIQFIITVSRHGKNVRYKKAFFKKTPEISRLFFVFICMQNQQMNEFAGLNELSRYLLEVIFQKGGAPPAKCFRKIFRTVFFFLIVAYEYEMASAYSNLSNYYFFSPLVIHVFIEKIRSYEA